MSIGAANLFTRNVLRTFINPNISAAGEAASAKLVSLLVKFGALVVIVFMPTQFAIDLQLLGGVWILQTFPAIVLGLYSLKLRPSALLVGWAAGMVVGTWMAYSTGLKPIFPVNIGGTVYPIYIGILAGGLNFIVSFVCSYAFGMAGFAEGRNETKPADYLLS
jgi:SSS family solute:Na+ symporter